MPKGLCEASTVCDRQLGSIATWLADRKVPSLFPALRGNFVNESLITFVIILYKIVVFYKAFYHFA